MIGDPIWGHFDEALQVGFIKLGCSLEADKKQKVLRCDRLTLTHGKLTLDLAQDWV
jgi:hypothetical protein